MPVEMPPILMVAPPSPIRPAVSVETRNAIPSSEDYWSACWPKTRRVSDVPSSAWRSPTFYLAPFVLCYLLVACAVTRLRGLGR